MAASLTPTPSASPGTGCPSSTNSLISPTWGKYEQAFVPEYNLGAMENPGLVTFTESYVFTSRAADSQYQARANTLLHEMAHMWFGDLVTMKWWDDLWLKESFADYMGTLGVDRTTDWDTAWVNFANNRKAWAYVQDQLPTTHPIVPTSRTWKPRSRTSTASPTPRALRCSSSSWPTSGSRPSLRGPASTSATTPTATPPSPNCSALGAASGRDLSEWARQWLQTSGISTLSCEITKATEVRSALSAVAVLQDAVDPTTGRQEPRPHRLRMASTI